MPTFFSARFSLALLLILVPARFAAGRSPDPADSQAIDRLLSGVSRAGEPGVAVLVLEDGKILFERGYGVRDLADRAPIDPETNFRLASVTKQFTAMAIMLLVHDGKLRYDDRLTDLFPRFPAYGRDVTIRNLLTHTSGLPDYDELMERQEKNGGPNWSPAHQIQDDEVLALLEREPAGRFAPGTRWEYSNSGYVVLGLVVSKVSGMPYRDFLARRIFAPLKMDHTVVYQNGKNAVDHRAFGYSRENGVLLERDQSASSATLGDGGIYSNLVDLQKWDQGLREHTLLGAEEMQAAVTPVRLTDGQLPYWPADPHAATPAEPVAIAYGFGWFLDPYRGHRRNYHSGETQGFRSTIERFLDDHLTIVVLSNRTDVRTEELSLKVADLLLAER
jgi:CubicO group peptidase (beta-lactamase class C family)